jgi:hypothetical protein
MKDFFNKLFGKKQPIKEEIPEQNPVDKLPPDERFVHLFREKGGKLLYAENDDEVVEYLKNILTENHWETVSCNHPVLLEHLELLGIPQDDDAPVFYTTCENLIASDGSILFSSNQLGEIRLNRYPENFIVFSKTSRFVLNKDESLTGIKFRFKGAIPTNISAVTDYNPHKEDPNFLNYGNLNSKNLYLILLEDL